MLNLPSVDLHYDRRIRPQNQLGKLRRVFRRLMLASTEALADGSFAVSVEVYYAGWEFVTSPYELRTR